MPELTLAYSRATLALQQSPFPALRKLCVEVRDTSVVLQGQVSSYFLKQVAQEAVMPVLDGHELINCVVVTH